ncbi:hypothetical protein SK854_05130 [Lentzea sp. BCCO 10_0061]|uniref:Uncharacterized protein n=1 Tax=Lentzea sokolovensis TaxID=3095429 RepID=A0ABU4UR27_9PSEU|nr:hypothetical protein [Lentzea sp. BCCO 10_0061]MDX8141484.1 hypothetical protein [Lentzea sp. BCCO 10_0061]
MSLDEAAEAALRERWSRSQRHITVFSVVLPALQLLLCTMIVVTAGDGSIWPTVISLAPVAIAAVVLRLWLRHQAPLDPQLWRPAAFLAVGVQLLFVAVPAYDIATSRTSDALTGPAILFFLSWAVAVATCVSAHRASRALLTPLVAELGSADLRLTLPVRAAATGPELVSARIVVERDRVEWTVRLHVRRSDSPRIDVSVPFRELLQVTPVTPPVVPDEFDRRRSSLRVSAIEAFAKQRRDAGRVGDRKIAEELMDEFVRKHFIQPDLDSNDMSYLGPRLSLVTVFSRGGQQQPSRADGAASPKQ